MLIQGKPELFTINGVEFAPWIELDGVTYEEEDVHSEESGRTLDATMHITWLGTIKKWGISCIPLPQIVAQNLLSVLQPGWKTLVVKYPGEQEERGVYYCGSRKMKLSRMDGNGVLLWNGLTFNLIERSPNAANI